MGPIRVPLEKVMVKARKQQWFRIAAAVLAAGAVGCGAEQGTGPGGDPVGSVGSALTTTTLYTVWPNAAAARSYVTGVPDDSNLVNDINSADFDASYVQGNTSATLSSFDLSYPVPAAGDGPVSAVNVKYYARNSLCTAAGACGQIYTQILNGSTVVATSAQHALPDQAQGWYMYADSFNLPAGAVSGISSLRTRVVTTVVLPYSTQPIRVSTVASDITYSY